MAELIRNGYKRLFEVKILHHYFLDDGVDDFQSPFNPNDSTAVREQKRSSREKKWNVYDIRRVLSITPSVSTEALITRLGGQFRQTATGFLVAIPDSAAIPANARFDFALMVEDGNFYQYTALPFYKNEANKAGRTQKIVELVYQGTVFRYKPNVFVWTNQNGTVRLANPAVPQKRFYLTKEIPDFVPGATYLAEALVKKDDNLYRAMNDKPQPATPPSANWHKLNVPPKITDPADPSFTYARLPAYVNQEDIPVIVPLAGSTGTPERGILLTGDVPESVFALIRIDAMPAGVDTEFQLLSGGQIKSPHPVFEIHFKNRATIWRYYDTNQKKFLDAPFNQPRGFTYFGNAGGTEKKPYPVFASLQTDAAGNLTKLYSDVL